MKLDTTNLESKKGAVRKMQAYIIIIVYKRFTILSSKEVKFLHDRIPNQITSHATREHIWQARSQPSGGGGGVRWWPKRGPSRVGWCVCVGGEGITIVSGPGGGGGSFEPPLATGLYGHHKLLKNF